MAISLLEAAPTPTGRADPDARDAGRSTALHHAAEFGCLEIVEVRMLPYTPVTPVSYDLNPLPSPHTLVPPRAGATRSSC